MKRPLLAPFTPLYAAATALRNALYNSGTLHSRSLPTPVISVGSLSAGGAGKTPFVAALAHLLHSAGYSPIILTRGYGRSSTAIEIVPPDGSAARYGDEPLLLARSTPAAIVVGSDRIRAGLLALSSRSNSTPRTNSAQPIFILDDGFQHRRLARCANIALITAADLADSLLPSGNLREPLSSLRRANIIVIRANESAVPAQIRRYAAPNSALWTIHRSLDTSALIALSPSPRIIAFCAIARPNDFFASLTSAGFPPTHNIAFRDHHTATARDIARIIAAAQSHKAAAIITTEKDLVRLTAAQIAQLSAAARLIAVPLRTTFDHPAAALAQLTTLCELQFPIAQQ
jgi:tetraacyldisaccharide 4'-kinase